MGYRSKMIITAITILVGASVGPFVSPVQAQSKRFQVLNTKKKSKKGVYRKAYDKKLKRIRTFKDSIIVRFKKGTSSSEIKAYMLRNNLQPKVKLGKRTYSCEVLSKSEDNLEEISNLINEKSASEAPSESETEIVSSIDLDEYKHVDQHSINTNKLGYLQWHLNNNGRNGLVPNADINIEGAWEFTKGSGVKVAVIDTGFDLGHPDINYYPISYDAHSGKADASAPIRSAENHGTSVAGIIAAKDNRIGVVGVAPEAQIIAIRLITDDGMITSSQVIEAHHKAVELGAKVINNSWGSYDPSLGDNEILTIPSIELELYRELAEDANDGKGVVVVFASGNNGARNFNNAPEARSAHNLAVGATDSSDQRASYSLYGDELDLVAPGGGAAGIVTTDRRDAIKKKKKKKRKMLLGYDKGDYTKTFVGTSAAAPVVSGIAALVWAANPDLTADQVKEILRNSANKSINSKYRFNLSGFNKEIGYGRVDAAAAVNLARTYE